MARLGPNTYDLAKYGSAFNQYTLEMDNEFNDNQSEIDMRELEKELGLDNNNSVVNAHEIQNKVIIEMADKDWIRRIYWRFNN